MLFFDSITFMFKVIDNKEKNTTLKEVKIETSL